MQGRRQVAARLDEALVNELVREYRAGAKGRVLATQFGLARSTVLKLLKARGVAIRYPRPSEQEEGQVERPDSED
jgi:hypothetical protein